MAIVWRDAVITKWTFWWRASTWTSLCSWSNMILDSGPCFQALRGTWLNTSYYFRTNDVYMSRPMFINPYIAWLSIDTSPLPFQHVARHIENVICVILITSKLRQVSKTQNVMSSNSLSWFLHVSWRHWLSHINDQYFMWSSRLGICVGHTTLPRIISPQYDIDLIPEHNLWS